MITLSMPLIHLDDPTPTSSHTRTPIPIKPRGGRVIAYALFRDGKYEFEVDQRFEQEIADEHPKVGFEFRDGRPSAVIVSDNTQRPAS
jgi:hypothetical protein